MRPALRKVPETKDVYKRQVRHRAHPFPQQRGFPKAGWRQQQHGLRLTLPDPGRDHGIHPPGLPRDAQIDGGQPAYADDLSVFLRCGAADTQPCLLYTSAPDDAS